MALDLKMLIDMPGGTIFATGILMDAQGQLHMASTGKQLRWVAVRGHDLGDWSVYCHFAADHNVAEVASIGDKVMDEDHIRRCVPCDDESIAHYRR